MSQSLSNVKPLPPLSATKLLAFIKALAASAKPIK
jgi:hypothetical protein